MLKESTARLLRGQKNRKCLKSLGAEEPQAQRMAGKLWFLANGERRWLGALADLSRWYRGPPEVSPVLQAWRILRPWTRATQRSFSLHSWVVLPRIVEPKLQRTRELRLNKWASNQLVSLGECHCWGSGAGSTQFTETSTGNPFSHHSTDAITLPCELVNPFGIRSLQYSEQLRFFR